MTRLTNRLGQLEAAYEASVRRRAVPSGMEAFGLLAQVDQVLRDAMAGPDLSGRIGLLASRLDRGDETDADMAVLAQFPASTMPARTLFGMYAAQLRFYPDDAVLPEEVGHV